MMHRLIVVLCAFVLTATGAVAAPWPVPPSYSAQLVAGQDHKRTGRMYRTPNAYRHEMRDGKEVVILNLASNLAYALLPGGFVLEINFNTGTFQPGGLLSGALLNPQPEGSEMVNGQATTRYRVSLNQPPTAEFKGKVWVTKDGIVMRVRGEGSFGGQAGKVEVEARGIVRGPQPDRLFDPGNDHGRLKLDAQSAARFLQAMSGK